MTRFDDMFADIIEGNAHYVATTPPLHLSGRAAKGLALVTCMDSRIDPLRAFGLQAGDMKILRNAGARVTEDVLRTLVLATYLLDVKRVIVMPHTQCRMASSTEADVHATILENNGVDTRSIEFRTIDDPMRTLQSDLQRIRSFPLLPDDLVVAGTMYHVETGVVEWFDY